MINFTNIVLSLSRSSESASVSVSKHIRGHVASFSDSTDTWTTYRQPAELFGLRNNIGLFCFDEATSSDRENAYLMGKIDFGLYDRNILADLPAIQTTRQGRPCTAVSYRSGTDDNKLDYLDDLFGGRNSQYETNPLTIQYEGLTDVELISRASTIRFNYYSEMGPQPDFIAGTNQEGIDKVTDYVNQTITTGGWYTNFMHWHWWDKDYSKEYFTLLKTLLDGQDVFSGSYSDIVEYYFVRESVDDISYDNGTVNINHSKKYPNSPYSKITVPLWVELNLSGTSFQGKNITTSHGGKIRSRGNDRYVISIDLDFDQTADSFSISETVTPSYINLNKPVVTRDGNNVSSDQPIKITLFSKLKTSVYELDVVVWERQLTLNTNFTLSTVLDTVNRDYYLGFTNSEGISGTIEF